MASAKFYVLHICFLQGLYKITYILTDKRQGGYMKEPKRESLDSIIRDKQITIVFQPIVSLADGSILGHEALSRITCECEIDSPEMLFSLAEKYNRIWELELICRTKTLEAASEFMGPHYRKKLFINVNPSIIHDGALQRGFTKEFLKQYKINPGNIIFEITERNVILDMEGFISSIDHYKSQNYRIAIDDTGAGYSGLNLISDVNPDYIKLDMKLIRGVNSDSLKYALVKGMVEFSKVSSTFVIAEGIETYEELNTLIELGVQYGQGYLIQRPDKEIKKISQEFMDHLKSIYSNKEENIKGDLFNIPISELCTDTDVIEPEESVPYVYEYFKQSPDCFGLCVVDKGVPIGIVTKEKLTLQLSGFYGFALNQKKEIGRLMERDFLSVDCNVSISEVSSMALAREIDKLYDFIVVTEGEKYIGTVTIKDLLQKTTEIKVSTAKHQNPLSGLPGNMIIEQKLTKCIIGQKEFTVAYFDIDNFKAYNDVYGFESGDLIIKLLADILKQGIEEGGFIGHVGGDDFVAVIDKHVTTDYFKDIEIKFETQVIDLYSQEDINNGFIVSVSRRGEIERFPLATITTVSINNKDKIYGNAFELTETLAELKKKAKNEKAVKQNIN